MKKIEIHQEIEKLILWLIPLIVLSEAASVFSKTMVNKTMALSTESQNLGEPLLSLFSMGFSFGELLLILQWLQYVPFILINAVIGIWLFRIVKKSSGRKWLWFAGGLCLSYWALLLYLFLLLLHADKDEAESSASNNV